MNHHVLSTRQASGFLAGADCDPSSHPMEPATHRFLTPNRSCPLRKYQERGLKGVFRGVPIRQKPAAHSEDHGTMPLHQNTESPFRRWLIATEEQGDQLTIGAHTRESQCAKRLKIIQDKLPGP